MRSRSCAFWPARAVRRISNRFARRRCMRATSGSAPRARGARAGKPIVFGVVALGLEPGLPRLQLVQALHHDGEVCLGDGLVEPHHHVAGLDRVAVADPQLADDAAGRVLDLLDVRIDHDEARRDHGAGKLGRRRKPADAAGEQGHDGDPAE